MKKLRFIAVALAIATITVAMPKGKLFDLSNAFSFAKAEEDSTDGSSDAGDSTGTTDGSDEDVDDGADDIIKTTKVNNIDGTTATYRITSDGTLILSGGIIQTYNSRPESTFCYEFEEYQYVKAVKIEAPLQVIGDATDMFAYFNDKGSIDGIEGISNLDTSQVTSMWSMFENSKFTSLDLSKFNTSNVTDMRSMFTNCSLKNLDLSSFDTRNVINMSAMFSNCASLEEIKFGDSFDTSNVTDMSMMFQGCAKLEEIERNSAAFDTGKVTDMSYMFDGCKVLKDFNFRDFNTSNVTTMKAMFRECLAFKSLDLTSFNTSNVTDMSLMFKCNNLTDLSGMDGWHIVQNDSSCNPSFYGMFEGCTSLKSLRGLENWDTGYIHVMDNMFDGCENLTDISALKNWKTDKLDSTRYMFNNCKSLTSNDDIKSWTLRDAAHMWDSCTSLKIPLVTEFVNENEGTTATYTISYDDKGGKVLTISGGVINTMDNNQSSSESENYRYKSNESKYSKIIIEDDVTIENAKNMFSGETIGVIDGLEHLKGIKNAAYMFFNCVFTKDIDFSSLDLTQCDNVSGMFSYVTATRGSFTAEFSGFAKDTDASGMFQGGKFKDINVNNMNVSNVADFSHMFGYTQQDDTIKDGKYVWRTYDDTLDIHDWDFSSATNMNSMFAFCYFSHINLDTDKDFGCDVDKIKARSPKQEVDCDNMFNYAEVLQEIDLSGLSIRFAPSLKGFAYYCGCVEKIKIGPYHDWTKVNNITNFISGNHFLRSIDFENVKAELPEKKLNYYGTYEDAETFLGGGNGNTSLPADGDYIKSLYPYSDMSYNGRGNYLQYMDLSNISAKGILNLWNFPVLQTLKLGKVKKLSLSDLPSLKKLDLTDTGCQTGNDFDHMNNLEEIKAGKELKNVPYSAYSNRLFATDFLYSMDNGKTWSVGKKGTVNDILKQDHGNIIFRSKYDISLKSPFFVSDYSMPIPYIRRQYDVLYSPSASESKKTKAKNNILKWIKSNVVITEYGVNKQSEIIQKNVPLYIEDIEDIPVDKSWAKVEKNNYDHMYFNRKPYYTRYPSLHEIPSHSFGLDIYIRDSNNDETIWNWFVFPYYAPAKPQLIPVSPTISRVPQIAPAKVPEDESDEPDRPSEVMPTDTPADEPGNEKPSAPDTSNNQEIVIPITPNDAADSNTDNNAVADDDSLDNSSQSSDDADKNSDVSDGGQTTIDIHETQPATKPTITNDTKKPSKAKNDKTIGVDVNGGTPGAETDIPKDGMPGDADSTYVNAPKATGKSSSGTTAKAPKTGETPLTEPIVAMIAGATLLIVGLCTVKKRKRCR